MSDVTRLIWCDQVDSTSSHLIRLLKDGAPVGTAVAAAGQTGGRGQRGRAWHSPNGAGVYLSVAVDPLATSGLPFAAALAAAETLDRDCGVAASVRWPNDLLASDATGERRKIGGILVESIASPKTCIIGCGLNLNNDSFPPEAGMAISARMINGRQFDVRTCAEGLLKSLDKFVIRLRSDGLEAILESWRKLDVTPGSQIRLATSSGDTMVRAAGVDSAGRLLVQNGSELVAVESAGTVQWPTAQHG